MIRTLFAKSLGDAKWMLAAFLAVAFFFPWLYIWLTSMINMPAFSQFLANAVPKNWERVSGMSFSRIATPSGQVALLFTHPLILLSAAVWAIARGSDCVSGEIGRGTLEMLLGQPVRRTTLFATHGLVTVFGSALLALATWCGIATGLATIAMPEHVPPTLFVPPAVNLFGLMVCLGGMAALASAFDSQRWRTIGLMVGVYVVSAVLDVASRIHDRWEWISYFSFFRAYKPQTMAAQSSDVWSLLENHNGAVAGLGLGGYQIVLFAVGLVCYAGGAAVFSRREIPAPL